MKHALVVEDQTVLAQWLADTLRDAFPGIDVVLAGTLSAARTEVARRKPDVALVDLGLPDGTGIDLIRELSMLHGDCQCIVSTIYADDQHIFPALRAGASGYLLKDQPRERIVQSLRGIVGGEPPLSAAIARRLLRIFGDTAATSSEAAQPERQLSPRERETLVLIAKGCKLADVSQHLGVTRNTAAGFIKNVYRKLKISSRAEATLEATRMGLVNPHL